MDIIILFLLLCTALAIWREAHRGVVLGLWIIALVLMAGLFRYHVTDSLGLSF